MLSFPSLRLMPAAVARAACAALFATAALADASSAQVAQSSRPAASAARVHYVVLWRTEFLSRPDTAAPVLAWLDSGQVVMPDGDEHYQTGHARITVNGRRGWVDNGYIKRVLTRVQVDTLRNTVTRPASAPPQRKPGDPREPDRVLPTRRP